MTFTYDVSTDIGRVRLLVPDRDQATPVFQDEEIAAFLTLEGAVHRAAAAALETVGADIVLTLRVTRSLGLEVDGAAASREVRQRAAALRDQAEYADQASGFFDVAEMVVDDFSYRERLAADVLRSGL